MDGDILAKFRSPVDADKKFTPGSIEAFRKQTITDPEALRQAVHLWLNTNADMIGQVANALEFSGDVGEIPFVSQPVGYGELTYLLMWWCDQSPYNIDATPFIDFLVALDDVSFEGWHKNELDAFYRLNKASDRAIHVAYRMTNAAFIGAGKTPPPANVELKGNQKAIVEVVRKAARRLTTEELLGQLDQAGLPSSSATKQQFAFLVQAGALTNANDGKGYGLPEWATES